VPSDPVQSDFSFFGEPFHGADSRWLGGLRFALLLGGFCISTVELEDVLAGERLFDPIVRRRG
jgi:hypothetical protein